MEKLTAKQITWGILLIAFLLRLPYFFISLAYDEIWTVSRFIKLPVQKLLFDLSLPNNHPLNSILIKCMNFLPLDVNFIRLPHLIAGFISILLIGYLAKRMAGKAAALWSMFFAALNAPLIVYSNQARGYALQIMFLLIFGCTLLKAVELNREKKRSAAVIAAMTVSAAAAVMTLSTSVLYLAGVVLILWNYNQWKAIPRKSMAALLAAALICALYILLNFSGLSAARKWGESISSMSGYFQWLWGVLYHVVPGTLLPFALYYLVKFRQYAVGYGVFLLLLFGSAIFTNGGPERVYLPLCALFCIIAGAGAGVVQERFAQKHQRQLLLLAGIALAAAGYFYQISSWRFPDYFPVLKKIETLPSDTLVIYPAGDGYVVRSNSRSWAVKQYCNTLYTNSELKEMLLLNSPGRINGADDCYNEKTLPLELDIPQEKFAGIPAQRVQLQQLKSAPANNQQPMIAVYCSNSKSGFNAVKKLLENNGKVLFLNCWLSVYDGDSSKRMYCCTWYIAPGAVSVEKLKNIQEAAVLYYLQK